MSKPETRNAPEGSRDSVPRSKGKRFLLRLALGLTIALALLAVAEGIVRLGGWAPPRPMISPLGGPWNVKMDAGGWTPEHGFYTKCGGRREQPCLANPGLRVSIYGGSAVEGVPLPPLVSFPHQLQRLLVRLGIDEPIEVLNHGVSGFASRQMVWRMRGTIPFEKPRVVILFSGNNELWEVVGRKGFAPLYHPYLEYLRVLLFDHVALYRLLGSATGLSPTTAGNDRDGRDLPDSHEEQTFIDEGDRRFAAWFYKRNIKKIVKLARRQDTGLILATVPGNVLHHNDGGLSPDEECIRVLEGAVEGGDSAQIKDILQDCKDELRSQPANQWVADLFLQAGMDDLAREYFGRAEYYCQSGARGSDRLRQVVREVAEDEGVPLCDVASRLESLSQNGIAGFDVFVDTLHFNSEGHRRVARILLECLAENGYITADSITRGALTSDALKRQDGEFHLDVWSNYEHSSEVSLKEVPGDLKGEAGFRETEAGHQDFFLFQYDRAMKHYSKALKQGAPRCATLYNRALAGLFARRTRTARKDCEAAARACPDDLDIMNLLRIFHAAEGD